MSTNFFRVAPLFFIALGFSQLDSDAAFARTFSGYECEDDCQGHARGYRWAERRAIDTDDRCPEGNSQSFHEGCLAFVADPYRGADQDDDGDEIEE